MNLPYVTRSALRDLLRQDGQTEQVIKNALNPKSASKMVNIMLRDGLIEEYENGFVLTDEIEASAWLLAR